jgi:hypothetical protein
MDRRGRIREIGRKSAESVFLLCAGLWLGSLVMTGATAGILFSTMRTLEPSFGRFAAYEGPHSNLGAGVVQNRIFLAGDVVQFIGATGTLASTIALLTLFALPLRRISTGIRLFAQGAAMLLVSFHLFVLVPRMQENAEAYWSAAEGGDLAAAALASDAFQADHPTATRVLISTAVVVAVLLVSGAWSAASAGQGEGRTRRGPAPEEPRLVRTPVKAGGRA